jgi:cysteine desulfurase
MTTVVIPMPPGSRAASSPAGAGDVAEPGSRGWPSPDAGGGPNGSGAGVTGGGWYGLASDTAFARPARRLGAPDGRDIRGSLRELPRLAVGAGRVASRRTIDAHMTIYLDHASTTPLRPEALDAMLPFLGGVFGNPSSAHSFGRAARSALDEAHERVAAALGGQAREIVFTSGGTEANNLAIKGAAWAGKARGNRIVISPVEHHGVAHAARHLEKFGFVVTEVPVDRCGRVDPDELAATLDDRTILVSVMLANNEVGTLEPIRRIADRVRERRGILLHVDAVQAFPYVDVDVAAMGADLVTVSAHKLDGPKGIGALWIRRGTQLMVQQHGGSQERYRRAGTENVAGAVGFGVAAACAVADRPRVAIRLAALRGRLETACLAVEGVEMTGHPSDRLPGLCSMIVHDVDGAALVNALDLEGIAVSTGSACTSGSNEPSHVLLAMGYPEERARGSVRVSLGRATTDAEVIEAAAVISRVIRDVRAGALSLAAEQGAGGASPAAMTQSPWSVP